MKKLIYVLFLCLILVVINVAAQQTEEVQIVKKLEESKFEKLFKTKGEIVLSESYIIIKRGENTPEVLARIGWVEGEQNKTYAAAFGSTIIDFDRLDLLKSDVERVIEKIETAIEDKTINSVNYAFLDDFIINYYEWVNTDSEQYRNVYFKYGGYTYQDKTTQKLKSFLDSIDKVQAKLISLGATKKVAVRKK